MLTRPPHVSEADGLEAIELAESVGLRLDPWQKLIVRVALASDASGRHAASEVGYLVARQNGKGAALEAIVLHGMFLVGDPLTLWTAHQFKTSSEAFLRVRGWIDGSDELRSKVKRINAAHGEEGIELHDGPRLRFLARSKSSGRGFSPQRIIFDEAQELAKVAAEAMLPSMRAQWNRQAIYTGTVPGPDINNPEHFTRLRDRGRAGNAGRLAWLEWTPAGSADPDEARAIDLSDPDVWAQASPGVGYRDGLGLDTLADDYDSLSADSFARECLSIWPSIPDLDMDKAFGPGVWAAAATTDDPGDPVAVGVAVTFDRSAASIGMADGAPVTHLAAVDRREGTTWVAAEVARIQARYDVPVFIKAKSAAATLIQAIEDAGATVTVVSPDDYFAACADLYDGMPEGHYRHGNYKPLNEAVGAAEKRKVGNRWAWDGLAVDMLEAVTLAAHGARNSPDPEPAAYFV